MANNKKLKALYHRLGLKYRLSDHIIKEIVESQFEFIYSKISKIDFRSIQTEEEFEKLKTNFIIKYWGKLHSNYNVLKKVQKQSKTAKKYTKQRYGRKNGELQ